MSEGSMTNSISEAINALAVELTEIAIMELDADEDNTVQIEAFGTQAEAKIIAALPALLSLAKPIRTGRLPTSADVGGAKPVGGEDIAAVFAEDLNRQAQRLGIMPGAAESPGGWRDRVRFAALTAMKEDDRG